jgi:hypothetical protein
MEVSVREVYGNKVRIDARVHAQGYNGNTVLTDVLPLEQVFRNHTDCCRAYDELMSVTA